MAFDLSENAKQKLHETITHYSSARSALLPALWLVQEERGYVSDEAIEYVARFLDMPIAEVYGAVTFYTMLNRRKIGKYHIQVCRNICCWLRGAEDVVQYLKMRLKIDIGETTEDGMFTLSTVECIGACGSAPVMQVNNEYYENLTMEKIDDILGSLRTASA